MPGVDDENVGPPRRRLFVRTVKVPGRKNCEPSVECGNPLLCDRSARHRHRRYCNLPLHWTHGIGGHPDPIRPIMRSRVAVGRACTVTPRCCHRGWRLRRREDRSSGQAQPALGDISAPRRARRRHRRTVLDCAEGRAGQRGSNRSCLGRRLVLLPDGPLSTGRVDSATAPSVA